MLFGAKLLYILIIAVIAKCDDGVQSKPFELNDFLNGTYAGKEWNATWITGDTLVYTLDTDNSVYLFNVKNNKQKPLFDANVLEKYPDATYTISKDLKYALLRYNVQEIFRHSTTSQYAIYSIADDKYYEVHEEKHLQTARWTPKGNGLIYVFENNIYYLQEASSSKPKRITNDGIPGIVYNGVPDWVYEEEVLASVLPLWLSPDGNYLVYAQFNDTTVKEFSYSVYGTPGDIKDQYPKIVSIRYPKVGEINPTVSLMVYNLMVGNDGPQFAYELNDDSILYDVVWLDNTTFVSVLMNRVQNKAAFYRCRTNMQCNFERFKLETKNGWLTNPTPKYDTEGNKMIAIVSQPEGDDFFKHLVLVEVETGNVRRLTRGKRVVTEILGWDFKTSNVYYTGSVENRPSQQQIYVVNVDTLDDKCLTCEYETPEGFCKYTVASFSSDHTYYAKLCAGPGPLYATIDSTTARKESERFVWEDNRLLREKMANLSRPIVKDAIVDVADGYTANVRLLLPPDFDETRKYPMIVEVYAGPDSNQISDTFGLSFRDYIVTSRKYIYTLIDGRGSGRRGDNLMFEVYKRFGTVEIEDQINVTRHLQDNYSFIDRNRTAIWGWSYGGFATAWALIKDEENVFTCGLSVAPVTNFIYYDSIYTERYMGLPNKTNNEYGYNNTDVTRHVESFKNKTYFLIHGNADDNVHYQQSMLLAKALEQADVMFQLMSYPDENHSLQHVAPHLYHNIDRYWRKCFGLPYPQ